MCKAAIFSSNDAELVESIIAYNHNKLKIGAIVTNMPDSAVIAVANRHGIKCKCFDHRKYPSRISHEQAVVSFLKANNIQLMVFAHYMRLITKFFVDQYRNRIINIHPSLLPAFKGAKGYQDAYNAGVSTSGCTIHYVDEGLDTGDIILQRSVPRYEDDTFEAFQNRVHGVECEAINTVLESLVV